MSNLEAFILGIIQGLSEFLPVSSSGHLELGSIILGTKSKDNLLFSVVVHLATALATIIVFRKDIFEIFLSLVKLKGDDASMTAIKILISMIPIFIVGIFFKEHVESLFTGNLFLVGAMLIFTSLLLLVAEFKKSGETPVSFSDAFIIGIAQAVAVLPGISRSGASKSITFSS